MGIHNLDTHSQQVLMPVMLMPMDTSNSKAASQIACRRCRWCIGSVPLIPRFSFHGPR
ncbi:hypothetical protein [Dickeya zeae]|uniref:hypothetical protein n=1 Tax=Dickeya zeae TaxID=204042 RepID=UPI001F3ADA44|nr:hypothetical protein [Dickeya zeae]UJR61478.1 hypothetical protein HJ586_04185 [Dickeya zeae]